MSGPETTDPDATDPQAAAPDMTDADMADADMTDADMAEAGLLTGMARLAGRLRPGQAGGPPAVVSRRDDRLIVRCGEVVLKAHADTADPARLAARLRFAARPALRPVLLAPLELASVPGTYTIRVGGHQVSAWPAGVSLGTEDADDAPWEQAAALLARLHRVPVGPADLAVLPPATVLRRLTDRVSRLRRHAGHPLVAPVLAAWATLTEPAPSAIRPGRPTTVIHGDWHFGQLVNLPAAGWRIIDVDDLGLGDPAWDLGRPAAWFATGLLPVESWARFLGTYTACGGPAVPDRDDPWATLDLPARALTVEYAATAVAARLDAEPAGAAPRSGGAAHVDDRHLGADARPGGRLGADHPGTGLDSVSLAFVDACARIAGTAGDASPSRLCGG
ncbi:phosphotransferase family protein [Frankia sp. QA3]|uniref:phosphotransferase family protein n=1 Tax=Frankia sp. QA3 TaxID=710111 RepID=UPI000269C7EF|nr:aminoglycoside phosphotransferase family protein [Frankia sp. QA3]EIV93664.1 putative aminoglycoside phosphotransferase [Frankia sp. QA3]